uniref:Importin subunit alpha n=1 Tax=Ciona savignyi TaxID=51511 RepID=H2YTX7_CIOSA
QNLRKKRQDGNVQLRKCKRDEQLLKRRNINMEDLNTSPLKEMNRQVGDVFVATVLVSGSLVMKFDDIVIGITQSSDEAQQFICTQNARKILSRERHPPISKMVEANIVTKLVEFLSWTHNPAMQFEAAWALTNIASGNSEQTTAVVNSGAVPSLIALLCNEQKNAMWALGNIAGDGASMRDFVLKKGIVKPLVQLVTDDAPVMTTTPKNDTFPAPIEFLPPKPHMDSLSTTFFSYITTYVKTDVCWALSYITDGPNDRIELVLKTGVVEELVRLLKNTSDGLLLTPVLRVIGNIVTGTDQQTQVLDLGTLEAFPKLLAHDKPTIQKEAAWTLSNITAGTQSQIQAVIDHHLIPILIALLMKGDYKTQKEACWAITNYTSGASLQQLIYLGNNNVIPALCCLLEVKEPKILQVCLDGITNMLLAAEKVDELEAMCCLMESCGGVDCIEKLQEHPNETVYKMSLNIIDHFFSGDQDEQENIAPKTAENNDYFQFSAEDKNPSGFSL